MDSYSSFYNEHLENNLSTNENERSCDEINQCFMEYSLQSEYNMAHMSPIDKLIAKNQQKLKRNSFAKNMYLTRQREKINEQNKSINSSYGDTSVSTKVKPRSRRINWSETFKERRRSRRLSNLPPLADIKKEIKNEEFCESYDDLPYDIVATNIKIEKNIKPEIIDDSYIYSDDIQQENDSNLILNASSDPNELSNIHMPQQMEFTQEIMQSTMNASLNHTYSENNFASASTSTTNFQCRNELPGSPELKYFGDFERKYMNEFLAEHNGDDISIHSSDQENDSNELSNNYMPQQVEFTQEIMGSPMNNTINHSKYFETVKLTTGLKPPPPAIKLVDLNLLREDLTHSSNLEMEGNTKLILNPPSDLHESFNNHMPQQFEFIQQNNGIFESTINDALNSSTYSENKAAPMGYNITNNFHYQFNPVLTSKTTENKRTDLNLVLKQELREECGDYEDIDFDQIDQVLCTETENNEQTNFYDYPYNNTNIHDPEIQESESSIPKILECWSFKTSERHIYSRMEENTSDTTSLKNTEQLNYEPCTFPKESQNENSSKRIKVIDSSSLLNINYQLESNDEPKSSIKNRSDTPKTYSRRKQNVKSKSTPYSEITRSANTANTFYMPPTNFDQTNNKQRNYKPILPKPPLPSVINNPKTQKKNKKKPILLNNITVKNEPGIEDKLEVINKIKKEIPQEIPILHREYSDLSLADKVLYREKLTFVTALGLVSLSELKNIIKKEKDVSNHISSSKGYRNQKNTRARTGLGRRSLMMQYPNDKNIAEPILIPERSTGFPYHPGRACVRKCFACRQKLGAFDTACHIGQVKDLDKQKLCLENVPHLIGPNSCLCPTCFRNAGKKSSKAYLPKNVCMFMSCKVPATKHFNSEWVNKIKSMLIKKGARIRSWANSAVSLPTCNIHHDEILNVIQCKLCGNRTTHKIVMEKSVIDDFQTVLSEDKIPVTLDEDSFICKSCHVYLLEKTERNSSSLNKPKDITNHCSIVIERICEHHKINEPLCKLEKNIMDIKDTDHNGFEIPPKVKSTKPNTKNKIFDIHIKDVDQNIFKISSKATSTIPNTANKIPENRINNSDQNVIKIPSNVKSFEPNAVNKIHLDDIRNAEKIEFKIPAKVSSTIPNTGKQICENNTTDTKPIALEIPPKVILKHSKANKISTKNSIKTSTNNKNDQLIMVSSIQPIKTKLVDNNNINCQTINFPSVLQPGRLDTTLSSKVIQKQPLTPQPNVKLVHKKERVKINNKPLRQCNLKQILHPPSTNNMPLGKPPKFISIQEFSDPTKVLPCKPKQLVGPVVGTSILPLADPMSLPNLPEFQSDESYKVNVASDVFKLFQELQKPFSNSIELFRHLLLLEKYRLQGDLIIQNKNSEVSHSLKHKSATMNIKSSKSVYSFPQFKSKILLSKDNEYSSSGPSTPLQTPYKNTITPINCFDNDGRITKKPKMMKDHQTMSTNTKEHVKQNSSTPYIPLKITTTTSNKFISIPLSVISQSIICKPSEIYNSKPNNQFIVSPTSTTVTSNPSKLSLVSTNSPEFATTAAQYVRFATIKNVPLKRVYPLNLDSAASLNTPGNFRQILPSAPNFKRNILPTSTKKVEVISAESLKNLRVIRTTQRLTPEDLALAQKNAAINAKSPMQMGVIQESS